MASVSLSYFMGRLLHFPFYLATGTWVILVEFAMSLVEMYSMNDRGKVDI
jgi:hypothetical protein